MNLSFSGTIIIIISLICAVFLVPDVNATTLDIAYSNVPAVVENIFGQVFGKKISPTESTYWKGRARSDKKTEESLRGAMLFHKSKGLTMPKTNAKNKAGQVAGIQSGKLKDCVFDDDWGNPHQFRNVNEEFCRGMMKIWIKGYKPLPIPSYTPSTFVGPSFAPIPTVAPYVRKPIEIKSQDCQRVSKGGYITKLCPESFWL